VQKRRASQNHAIGIGPLGRVDPLRLGWIPKVTSGGKTNYPVRKGPPYRKREVDLKRHETRWFGKQTPRNSGSWATPWHAIVKQPHQFF